MNRLFVVDVPAPPSGGAGRWPPADVTASATGETNEVDLSEVYSEHYRSLVRFLYRRTSDQALAEDLAQEAFVRAIEHRPEQPKAWLFQVAANLARDAYRRRAVRRRHLELVGDDQATGVAGPALPDTAFEQRRATSRVRRALDQLAPNDRDSLLLKEEGLSYDEISEVLGLSRGSIGTTLSRARARLATEYAKLEVEGSQNDAAH